MNLETARASAARPAARGDGPATGSAALRRRAGAVVCAALVAVVAASGVVAGPSPAAARSAPIEGFADLVERVAPAVVNISTSRSTGRERDRDEEPGLPFPQLPPGSDFEEYFREFFSRREQERRHARPNTSLGSGFIVDPAGYVVTNNHVIGDGEGRVEVVLKDESSYEAEVIGVDPKTDLALLKIEREEPFPYVEFGDSDVIRVGDWVIAIGNPFGLGSSVSVGIISARGRNINAGPYDDFLQVDAPINRGNSGGPSFNLDGEVIGVNTAIFSPSGGNVGIGFAIPANLAKPVVESLKDTGRVARGWLGVRIQSVSDEIADSLGLDSAEGALIASVTPDGPAEAAKIQAGDVVLRFDGKPVRKMRSLPRLVAATPIGKEVDVVVWRDGHEETVSVTVGELPEEPELAALGDPREVPSVAEVESLGLTIANLDEETRDRFGVAAEVDGGVVIVDVDSDGPAGGQDLRPGDVILEVDQEEVGSPGDVLARVRRAEGDGRRSVLLLIDRDGDSVFVAVRLGQG